MLKFLFISACIFNLYTCEAQGSRSSRPEKTITFSGYQWTVRNSGRKQGPGPNYFNAFSAFVDDDGYLHLWIRKDKLSGQWQCAEITSVQSFEYGTYQFTVEGPIDHLDKNMVLGLFNYSGNDSLDEMDIEIARWGDSSNPNLNYTIWPAKKEFKNSSISKEFVLKSNLSTHYIRRNADTVVCASFNGVSTDPKDEIFSHTFTGPAVSISHFAMPIHINFWLFKGLPPDNPAPFEIIIRSFQYKP